MHGVAWRMVIGPNSKGRKKGKCLIPVGHLLYMHLMSYIKICGDEKTKTQKKKKQKNKKQKNKAQIRFGYFFLDGLY